MSYEDNFKKYNPIIYKMVKNILSSKRLAHLYLFATDSNYVINDEVWYFVEELIEKRDPLKYNDLVLIDGSSEQITKDVIVRALEKLSTTALDAINKKFLIIKNVENANFQSLNALLKFIEEPTPSTYILLTTNNLQRVLPTIKSRAQIFKLKPIMNEYLESSLKNENVNTEDALILSKIASSLDEAHHFIQNLDFSNLKNSIFKILDNSVNNNGYFITNLDSLLNKDNYLLVGKILAFFINEIQNINLGLNSNISSKNYDCILKYKSNSFNSFKALQTIDEFIRALEANANFNLAKSKFLIEWQEAYV